jgi:hypothetical protein
MSGFLAFLLIVLLVLGIATGFHASGQGKSGAFWGAMAFCFGLFGLVAYAISLSSD